MTLYWIHYMKGKFTWFEVWYICYMLIHKISALHYESHLFSWFLSHSDNLWFQYEDHYPMLHHYAASPHELLAPCSFFHLDLVSFCLQVEGILALPSICETVCVAPFLWSAFSVGWWYKGWGGITVQANGDTCKRQDQSKSL